MLFYNSEPAFSDADLECFTRSVGDSAKAGDSRKIGQFGLGAITAYHFTDVLQLLTGTRGQPLYVPQLLSFCTHLSTQVMHLNQKQMQSFATVQPLPQAHSQRFI